MSSRANKRPEPCSEEHCGSRRFHIDNDGYTYCDQGHQQSHVSSSLTSTPSTIHNTSLTILKARHCHRRRHRRASPTRPQTTTPRFRRRIHSQPLTRLHRIPGFGTIPPRPATYPEEAGFMADNSCELPRRPRGAFVQFIPPMSSSHQKNEGRKRPVCQTLFQRVRLKSTKTRGRK
jgi:hypothetical protein